jgi:hypothetical protein
MKPGEWRSDASPVHWLTRDEMIQMIMSQLKDRRSLYCERCHAKVLDPLCGSCLELALRELEASDAH